MLNMYNTAVLVWLLARVAISVVRVLAELTIGVYMSQYNSEAGDYLHELADVLCDRFHSARSIQVLHAQQIVERPGTITSSAIIAHKLHMLHKIVMRYQLT